jgi:carboxylesterase type B
MHVFLLLLAFCVQELVATKLVVDLGYAKYRGLDFGNGVTRWAGMRYARSPSRLDGLRFTAPQDPLPDTTTVDATKVCTLQFVM